MVLSLHVFILKLTNNIELEHNKNIVQNQSPISLQVFYFNLLRLRTDSPYRTFTSYGLKGPLTPLPKPFIVGLVTVSDGKIRGI